MTLVKDVQALLEDAPQVAQVLGLNLGGQNFGSLQPFDGFPQLAGALFSQLCLSDAIGDIVHRVYASEAQLVEMTLYDIAETARRNFEPGGEAATLLFSRGVQAIMAHRVAHQLWVAGDTSLSLAIKAASGRAFATDIHPAAQMGAGLWLDHGLGFVVGETCVIAEDVSIWHNVTLGSTLNDSGPHRHPHIGAGTVIGAGAILLGGITIGAGANIAAGAIVVEDIPDGRVAAGAKATLRGPAGVSFTPIKGTQT
ncbi:serine O-acetyltransferase [Pseudophaeobacter leonis]|uniref:serine O-acetyltransferase n=1 Tax=Pseudophaeobacter leonis TaxID=1144477 RepID=UPI0009F4C561|nr:serine acetyltransferase [Pseudophaeobacter leonis]